MNKRIAVIDGGFSDEAQISFKSADTVMYNLDPDQYEAHRIRITDNNWIYDPEGRRLSVDKNDFSVDLDGVKLLFDCAMIIIHGTPGEDGKLQGYFDLIGLPYTTCDQLTSTLTFNKYFCNRVLETYGIKCAKALLFRHSNEFTDQQVIDQLGLPCFVKPNDGGSSFGAAKVNTAAELRDCILNAFEHGKQVIVEEFMAGTEVTNGIYHNGQDIQPLPVTEIVTTNDFFDYKAKYNGESEEITPARISDELTKSIKSTSKDIYQKLGLDGVCRVDYIIREGVPHVIEINTIPGQSAESITPKMAAIEGISMAQLFSTLIENATGR
ncbi:MAG: D-alanine--D-alanine ligase [Flavobacteriales bacterium]|nr:D-alanine--D-alanine ligase [Flavobacteriales bacterium]